MRPAMKASVAFTAALVILLLASPIQASLPRQQRRRLTASAVAVSSSTARDGASVSSTSQATSTGAPAASIVVAKGSGQGTTINCEQEAKNNETLYKECIKDKSNSNGTASAASVPSAGTTTVPWANATRCTKPASAYQVKKDAQGKPWGWENNSTSCALRDDKGNATA